MWKELGRQVKLWQAVRAISQWRSSIFAMIMYVLRHERFWTRALLSATVESSEIWLNNMSHHQLECWKDLTNDEMEKTTEQKPRWHKPTNSWFMENPSSPKNSSLERSGCSDGQQEIGMAPCQVFQLPLAVENGVVDGIVLVILVILVNKKQPTDCQHFGHIFHPWCIPESHLYRPCHHSDRYFFWYRHGAFFDVVRILKMPWIRHDLRFEAGNFAWKLETKQWRAVAEKQICEITWLLAMVTRLVKWQLQLQPGMKWNWPDVHFQTSFK